MRPVAGGAPERAEPARPGLATSLLLALLLVLVPTGAALAASSLPVPPDTAGTAATPGADDPVSQIPVPSPAGSTDPATGTATGSATGAATGADTSAGAWAASCPSGLFGWVSSPTAADDCLADTLGSSVSWMFQYSITTVTTYVAFNPLRGNYWQVYLWHFGLLVVVALLVAVVQWLVSLVVDGAVEGMRSAGRSFVWLAVGLPAAFSVPFFLLLVDAGVLAVTGAFAGVFAGRVTELAGEVSSAIAIGDSPGALLAAVLLTAFLFPLLLVVLFAFVLRQIAVYAIPVFGQFGLLQAVAGDDGALRTYFRIMAGTLLFPLQFMDLLVIGVSFLDFSDGREGFISLLYIIGVVLFALLGGSFLSLVFGTYAGHAASAGVRRAGQRRRQRGRLWRPLRGAGERAPSRLEQSRLGAAAGSRWDARRDQRDARRAERAAARTPANPLYWLGRAPDAPRAEEAGTPGTPGTPRTYGDRARERRGRRVGGSAAPGSSAGGARPGAPGRPPRGRSPRGPRSE